MKVPLVATYRLQFREGMSFDAAVEIVPYLQRLGISHLYASPIYTAVSGSTHGYDVTDHNEIDPSLGGEEGFGRLHRALRREGMGLILDIVPNHMAASLENGWWRSVVELGQASPYARHFDVDWGEKLTLPILGREFRDVLEAGELKLEADPAEGCLALAYFDNHLPLHPSTYALIAERISGEEGLALSGLQGLASAGPELMGGFREAVGKLVKAQGPGLAEQLAGLSRDPAFLEALHEQQSWRLTFWKEARRHLSYRRFFEVIGLVGVRVEDEAVFKDVHRLTLSLVRAGMVDGLRIDHVDGLAAPGSYLARLREEVGPDVPIFVEKILERSERLPSEWPIQGTTGYEFISAAADLLVDAPGARKLEGAFGDLSGRPVERKEETRNAKLLILRRNFEGEFTRLADMASELAHGIAPDLSAFEIEVALAELIVGFPVYRTYGEAGWLAPRDLDILDRSMQTALAAGEASGEAIDFVASLLRGDEGTGRGPNAQRFRTRFQQLTGPVMAKAVEDTLFYRLNSLIALNEVGSSPDLEVGPVARFHQFMSDALSDGGLLATSTHDTKRGEDARARLYALAEAPTGWREAVERWRSMNAGLRTQAPDAITPEPEVEWLLYQALAGCWPSQASPDNGTPERLEKRFLPYVEKALREAKLRTDWIAVDELYENGVRAYASGLLSPENKRFLQDFELTLRPFVRAGGINGLSQTLAKLTAPGIPDIYQGSEGLDLSLVDPDNRRPIDFKALELQLDRGPSFDGIEAALEDGSFKQWMIAACLACRRQNAGLFAKGEHIPLAVHGEAADHFVAYLRAFDGSAALVVLQRLPLRLAQSTALAAPDAWLELPERYRDASFRGVLSRMDFSGAPSLRISSLLGGFPVMLALSRK